MRMNISLIIIKENNYFENDDLAYVYNPSYSEAGIGNCGFANLGKL
jgi:hypothetical protein